MSTEATGQYSRRQIHLMLHGWLWMALLMAAMIWLFHGGSGVGGGGGVASPLSASRPALTLLAALLGIAIGRADATAFGGSHRIAGWLGQGLWTALWFFMLLLLISDKPDLRAAAFGSALAAVFFGAFFTFVMGAGTGAGAKRDAPPPDRATPGRGAGLWLLLAMALLALPLALGDDFMPWAMWGAILVMSEAPPGRSPRLPDRDAARLARSARLRRLAVVALSALFAVVQAGRFVG